MARGPRNQPIPQDLSANQPWGELAQRLTAMACSRLRGRPEDARQLALDAIRQFFEPESTVVWDYEREPDPTRCLGSILNGLIRNHVRVRRTTSEVPMTQDTMDRAAGQVFEITPEFHAMQRQLALKVLDRVVQLSSNDHLVCRIVELAATGALDSDEQEVALSVPRATLYEARRRFRERLEQARQELEDGRS